MPTRYKLPKVVKNPKSSKSARRLIRSALRQHKTARAAARALGLANHSQLIRMLNGSLGDTPAMKAALYRADRRARLAWSFQRENNHDGAIDQAEVRRLWIELKSLTRRYESLMKECETESHSETN